MASVALLSTALWLGASTLTMGCATFGETRSEKVVSRSFHGTKLERTPALDGITGAARMDGGRLLVTATRAESCLVTSSETQQVDARVEQSPGGLGFAGELLCVAVAAPVAVVTLTRGEDTDALGLGSSLSKGTGVVAAVGAAVCAAAAVYDIARAKTREERVVREVPLAPTPAPCGLKPASGVTASLRTGAAGAPPRTAMTDEKGEATFEAPVELGPGATLELTVEGRTFSVSLPSAAVVSGAVPVVPEARLTRSSGRAARGGRILGP